MNLSMTHAKSERLHQSDFMLVTYSGHTREVVWSVLIAVFNFKMNTFQSNSHGLNK